MERIDKIIVQGVLGYADKDNICIVDEIKNTKGRDENAIVHIIKLYIYNYINEGIITIDREGNNINIKILYLPSNLEKIHWLQITDNIIKIKKKINDDTQQLGYKREGTTYDNIRKMQRVM